MALTVEKRALAQGHLGRVKRSVYRWPTATSFQWLASFLERAERDPNVVSVIVIGSAARPNVASDDLDLMVLCRDVLLFGEKAPIEVDIRKANVSSVEADIRAGQDVAIGTVRFGRPLLDKDGTWNSISSRWRSQLPLPDPAVALDRAAAARVRMEKMRVVGDEDARRELEIAYRTHLARAALAGAGVQPASRPELPSQLRDLGETELANDLQRALSYRRVALVPSSGGRGRSRPDRVSASQGRNTTDCGLPLTDLPRFDAPR